MNTRSTIAWLITFMCGFLGCGGGGTPAGPSPAPAPTPANLTPPAIESPKDRQQLDTLRPTLAVRNGTSDQPGARTYEFQISDSSDFSSTVVSAVQGFLNSVTTTSVAEGTGTTTFTPTADLQPTTRFYWRARLIQGSSTSAWSEVGRFNTRLVGFMRAGELYDPLIHGQTVGTRVGTVELVSGRGARIANASSHIRYKLPRTIAAGEFSMEVTGLRTNAPGDKSKVFGMQEGLGDFIVNPYRVSAEYRGVKAGPPNVVAWRAMFGSGDARIETGLLERIVVPLNANTTYLWKATWGGGFRLVILEGGLGGKVIYNRGESIDADYSGANPHYAFLGAPVGRSGSDSASVPGAIYRNVWLGNRPRPESLGSALQN